MLRAGEKCHALGVMLSLKTIAYNPEYSLEMLDSSLSIGAFGLQLLCNF